tara:strand:+ start:2225 stop:2524 length:300 start_codon:yes stop_codon:yes gene_type:complete
MTLGTDEFIRRFLLHVLPKGFHCIRHYGLLANTVRKHNLVKARECLNVSEPIIKPVVATDDNTGHSLHFIFPKCSSPMVVIDVLARTQKTRTPPLQWAA